MTESDPRISTALAVGGLYEVWIGTRDLGAAVRWWAAFGYAPEAEASFAAPEARALHGHASGGRSVRLRAAADHGLVRLIEWDEPGNAGLGTSGLNAAGSRWVGQFARSALLVANHAEAAQRAGALLEMGSPLFIDMSRAYAHLFGGRVPRPFEDELVALREFQLFGPETRQVIMERFGYDSPLLGTFSDSSLLRTTQIVQGCMVVQSDDPALLDFYVDLLDLRKSLDLEIPWAQAQASRTVFEIEEGETHWNIDLDEPRSGSGLAERRSGRLKIFRFPSRHRMRRVFELASPGSIGLSNYSWRVRDLAEARQRAIRLGAAAVGEMVRDEFGDPALTLRAPDGYVMTLVERP